MKDPITGKELCPGCNGFGWIATPAGIVLKAGTDWTCDECNGTGEAPSPERPR